MPITLSASKKHATAALGIIRSRLVTLVAGQYAGPHQSFRLTPKSSYRGGEAAKFPKFPASVTLLRKTLGLLRAEWKPFLCLTGLYLLLSWLLIGLPDSGQYTSIRDLLDSVFKEDVRSLKGAIALFVGAISGMLTPTKSELAQFITALIAANFSLAFIWVARQRAAGNDTGVRQALYNASAPLVVMAILIVVMLLQLVPATAGSWLLSFVFSANGVSGVEGVLLTLAATLLIALSLYMITPTVIAFMVATLPNTYPLAALRSARLLAYRRRATILLRIIGLAIFIGLIWLLLLGPVIALELYVNVPDWLPLVQITLDAATAVSLPFTTLYTYKLYRELLK